MAGASLFAGVVALRAAQTHAGLTYPDGYQYLLMARGLASSGHAYLRLGPRGDVLLPNADAAIKPLQPLIAAMLHGLGVSWMTASRGVSAVAGALSVILASLVALRVTDSRAAATSAGAVMLSSPSLAYWSGFTGPDSLALALALAASLAALSSRPVLAGMLWGLAATARPECAVIAIALLIAGTADPALRHQARRAAVAGMLTTTIVFVAARPPLELPTVWTIAAAPTPAIVGGLGLVATRRCSRWRANISVGLIGVPIAAAAVFAGTGARTWAAREWPLLIAAGAGLIVSTVAGPRRREVALRLAIVGLILYGVYTVKNPGVDRYLAIGLTPLVALSAALLVAAVGGMRRARLAVWAGVAASLLAAASTTIPASSHDMFQELAADLRAAHRPALLVTAAPDAYSYWLPGWSIRMARPGQTGTVLDDAAFRSLDPTLEVCGMQLASYLTAYGFTRPDGSVDGAPAMFMRGTVEPEGSECPSGRSGG